MRAALTKGEIERMYKKIKIKNFYIATRHLTGASKSYYRKLGISIFELKQSFQSHYVACGGK